MNQWIEVKATFDKAPEDWSIFVDAFDMYGCPGTLQTDRPPALSGYILDVSGGQERRDELASRLTELGVLKVDFQVVPDEDWSELWKIHFKPRRVGEKFVVRPTWEEFTVQSGDIELVLDPGQAFGTGDHPTTRVCLSALEKVPIEGKRILDLGTGSGILAIACAKLGAKEILATDIDAQSIEVTKQNLVLNGVDFRAEVCDGFPEGGPWDVVISNIISATLIRLSPDAYANVIEGGYWVVSGIIEGNWPEVKKAAEAQGFKYQEHVLEDEWVGAIFRR